MDILNSVDFERIKNKVMGLCSSPYRLATIEELRDAIEKSEPSFYGKLSKELLKKLMMLKVIDKQWEWGYGLESIILFALGILIKENRIEEFYYYQGVPIPDHLPLSPFARQITYLGKYRKVAYIKKEVNTLPLDTVQAKIDATFD